MRSVERFKDLKRMVVGKTKATAYPKAVEELSPQLEGLYMNRTTDARTPMHIMARSVFRAPWLIGLTAALFLEIGLFRASRTSGAGATAHWLEGAFYQSYVGASVLVYATLAAAIQCLVLGFHTFVRKPIPRPGLGQLVRTVSAFLLVVVFLCIVWQFHDCFIHKTKGYVIWPLE